MSLKPFVAISMSKRGSAVTGTVLGENACGRVTIQNGDPVRHNLPRQIFYSIDADMGVTKSLTLAFDYLG